MTRQSKRLIAPITMGLILNLISSCGMPIPLKKDFIIRDKQSIRQHSSTDPTFKPYITRFESHGKTHLNDPSFTIGDIPINFGDTENPTFQGVCFEYADGKKEIIIRKNWWNLAPEKYRESLLFHELGHCRLAREHQDEKFDHDGATHKLSLMNSVILLPSNFEEFESAYLRELFTSNTDTLIQSFMSP